MPKLREFFQAMSEDLFNFNILTIPFAFILGIAEGTLKCAITPLLFLPLLPYMYFLRLKAKNFALFLFLTWLPVVIGLLTPHKFIYTVFIGFLCSYSVRRRTKEDFSLTISFEGLCFPLTLLAAVYIFSDYLNVTYLKPVFYFQAMAIMLLAIIYTHLKGINRELELASANSLQSTKTITSFANKYLFIYIALFVVVFLLFRYVPFGRAAIFIGQGLVYIIRWLLAHIGESSDTPPALTEHYDVPNEIMSDGEPIPEWLQMLEEMLIYTVNIIFLLALLAFVVFFFLKLYRSFHSKRSSDLVYMDKFSEVTALKKEKSLRLTKNKISNPIRRKYFKRVNRFFKKGILKPSLTPMEIEKVLINKENLSEITPLYEKERYGTQNSFDNSTKGLE